MPSHGHRSTLLPCFPYNAHQTTGSSYLRGWQLLKISQPFKPAQTVVINDINCSSFHTLCTMFLPNAANTGRTKSIFIFTTFHFFIQVGVNMPVAASHWWNIPRAWLCERSHAPARQESLASAGQFDEAGKSVTGTKAQRSPVHIFIILRVLCCIPQRLQNSSVLAITAPHFIPSFGWQVFFLIHLIQWMHRWNAQYHGHSNSKHTYTYC